MTDKHTPGPWTVEEGPSVYARNREPVANMGFTEAREANAKLIAAAPELLKALEFERQISLGDDAEAYPQFVEMRDAAIKAAKGDA
ncbi:hypothetical protein LCGC14_2149090 [marine sediment metagenome]|uniref:Uncharacterized protein n=1 Tax=marine sediment metagenome TaxID=412755 RepID=A0A0F9DW95_9ZZZZ